MSKKNIRTITSLKDVPEVQTALAEIIVILKKQFKANGQAVTVKEIRAGMSADTKPHFDDARKLGVASGKFYVTRKGLMYSAYKQYMSLADRLYHVSWAIGLYEATTGQYLEDEDLLLQVPQLFRDLIAEGTVEGKKLALYMEDCARKALQLKSNHARISILYGKVEAGLRGLLPETLGTKTFSKSVKDFSDIKGIINDCNEIEHCKHCGSANVEIVGKHKDTLQCHDCRRFS